MHLYRGPRGGATKKTKQPEMLLSFWGLGAEEGERELTSHCVQPLGAFAPARSGLSCFLLKPAVRCSLWEEPQQACASGFIRPACLCVCVSAYPGEAPHSLSLSFLLCKMKTAARALSKELWEDYTQGFNLIQSLLGTVLASPGNLLGIHILNE